MNPLFFFLSLNRTDNQQATPLTCLLLSFISVAIIGRFMKTEQVWSSSIAFFLLVCLVSLTFTLTTECPPPPPQAICQSGL